MPKQKITKEMVVNAAFELARANGAEHITVKNIAEKLSCSVQPIYTYCENMDSLRYEVGLKAKEFVHRYAAEHTDSKDIFRSTGHAYVRLAEEEPNVFKLFIMHQRKGISSLSDLYDTETNPLLADKIAEQLKISIEKAKRLHLNMLIYTIGLGAIFSVTEPGISPEEIFSQQESAYEAFLIQISESGE